MATASALQKEPSPSDLLVVLPTSLKYGFRCYKQLKITHIVGFSLTTNCGWGDLGGEAYKAET